MVDEKIELGNRVEIRLDSEFWQSDGWLAGKVVRIEPYSEHRSFYWVELDKPALPQSGLQTRYVSVLNPRNIRLSGRKEADE